jgi:DNA (cytosine-5)-methyltransferase 1
MGQIKVVDLFAGCGGMSLGFQNAGFKLVSAFDNWDPAVEVYRKNFDHPVHKLDLGNKNAYKEVSSFLPDLVIGGPPCQDFSIAGHRNESLGRANLTMSFAEIISKIRPRYFVMENVPLVTKSAVYPKALKRFQSAGFGLTSVTLDASRCGVPQARKRFFLIGGLDLKHDQLEDDLLRGQAEKQMTLFDYFGNSLGFEHYFRVPRTYQRRGVFSIYEPAMTVRGVDRPVPSGYPPHPNDSAPISTKIRTLTQHERSLIQTFPESFVFDVAKTHANTLIGNAVPVKLAEYVATVLKRHISGR